MQRYMYLYINNTEIGFFFSGRKFSSQFTQPFLHLYDEKVVRKYNFFRSSMEPFLEGNR